MGLGEVGPVDRLLVAYLPQAHGPETLIHLHGENSSQFPDTRPEVTVNSPVSSAGNPGMVL